MKCVSAPGTPSIDCLQVLLQSCLITAYMFPQSWPPSASPNSLYYGLQVRMFIAFMCVYKLSPSWSRSASLSSLDHGLQMYFQIPSITISKIISKRTQSRPQSVSLSSLDCHIQTHVELLSSTAYNQSRYIVHRWVAILIYRYINTQMHRWEYHLTTWVFTIIER